MGAGLRRAVPHLLLHLKMHVGQDHLSRAPHKVLGLAFQAFNLKAVQPGVIVAGCNAQGIQVHGQHRLGPPGRGGQGQDAGAAAQVQHSSQGPLLAALPEKLEAMAGGGVQARAEDQARVQ